MTNDEEIQALRRSTTKDIEMSNLGENDTGGVQHRISRALETLESGDTSKMIGFRDQHIAALLMAIETDDEALREVGNGLGDALGRDRQGSFSRSDIIRLAIRVGLQQATPEYYERLTAVAAEHARNHL